MQARTVRTTASVDLRTTGSGTSSTRMSFGPWITVARMMGLSVRGCQPSTVLCSTVLPGSDIATWPVDYPDAGWAVVDVETTGLGRTDRVVSVGVYQLDPHGTVQDHWYTTVNPERDPGPVWI